MTRKLEITGLVKSYEDAVSLTEISDKETKSNEAFIKLTRIIKALNEEWEPNLSDWSQRKYFIYSKYLYSVVFGGNAYYGAAAGFGYSHTYSAPSFAIPGIGSLLCLKSVDLTKYVIETFPNLLKDFFMVEQ